VAPAAYARLSAVTDSIAAGAVDRGALRLALRVVQIGAIATVLVAAPYKAFDLDRYFVPKELALLLTAAIAGAIVLGAVRRVALTRVDTLLAAFLVVSVMSAARAANPWLAWRAVAVSVAGVTLFWVARAVARGGYEREVLAGVAAAIVAAAVTALAQAYGVHGEFLSLNRAPGGTLGNRNFVAHLAAAGLPLLVFSAIGARRPSRFLVGAAGVTIVVWALVLTRSRAAWLAAGVALVLAAFVVMRAPGRWGGFATGWRVAILGICAVAGTVLAVTLPNALHWKSQSPYLDSAVGVADFREGSGRGRLVQYANSLRLAVAHPVFGVGPGNWPVAYPRVATAHDPSIDDDGMTANPWPSSDWVAFVAERGLLATACLGLAMLGLVVAAIGERNDSLSSLALVATIIAVVIVGAFDAVMLLPTPSAIFWPAIGALSPPARARIVLPAPRIFRLPAALAVLLLGLLAAAHSVAQLVAMDAYGDGTRVAGVETAAQWDPGSYRVQTRLADIDLHRGHCGAARARAERARRLFPSAPEPRRVLEECR
jgi:O-antigen ligase